MNDLVRIQEDVQARTQAIAAAHGDWPCRKGCDDCCRNLAAPPRVTWFEWVAMAAAVEELPDEVQARIREPRGESRPVVCPLLDRQSGACLVYAVRPVACRAYGFYAERGGMLGCGRIEAIAREPGEWVWGNHTAIEERVARLGPARELWEWVDGKRR